MVEKWSSKLERVKRLSSKLMIEEMVLYGQDKQANDESNNFSILQDK
jgi:hypothetical protein